MEASCPEGLTVAIEVGGAFTDLVAYDDTRGSPITVKAPSTPPDFVDGVIGALEGADIDPDEVGLFKYGSTIATTAIAERTGARTGLITTKGFRDVLGMAPVARAAAPLVRRRNVLTVEERIDPEGGVRTELNEDEVREAARLFARRGIEAIAVCYLNGFVNPAHESRTKEILERVLGTGVAVCTSAEVLPEIGEMGRASTTVANAYVMPVVARHLRRLGAALSAWGYGGELLVAQACGGMMSAATAGRVPALTCRSAAACGAVGAARAGALAGFPDAITFDMGDRSTDLSLVRDGVPEIASLWRPDRGVSVHFSGVDLVSMRTGGSTEAWVDDGGSLRIGPGDRGVDLRSPGRAAEMVRPTITDAHLHLGRLYPAAHLGGSVDPRRAESVLARLGDQVGMSPTGTAGTILRIADAEMAEAARTMSTRKGRDPRTLALIAGGGTGPLHAVGVAQGLGIATVVVPPAAGTASALGLLHAGLREERKRSLLAASDEVEPGVLAAVFRDLEREAPTPDGGVRAHLELSLDVRYRGHAGFLTVPLDDAPEDQVAIDGILDRFRDRHEQVFGCRHQADAAAVEFVAARVALIGASSSARRARAPRGASRPRPRQVRPVYFDESDGFVDTPVYGRATFEPGSYLDGPALVEQYDTMALVPPGTTLEVDARLNLLIDVRQEATSRRRPGVPAGR